VRTLFDAVNAADLASLDDVLARNFRSYAVDGMRARTGMKVLGDGPCPDSTQTIVRFVHFRRSQVWW
jgi:hypothetical protein